MIKGENLELLKVGYSVEQYNEIYNLLKCIFWEEIKSRIPVINGIESYKQDKLYKEEEKRLEKVIEIIQEKQLRLDIEKLDKEFVYTEEFARTIFYILEKVRGDWRNEKLEYYANVMINYSLKEFSQDFYKEGIVDKLGSYTIEHIIMLKEYYDAEKEKAEVKTKLDSSYAEICRSTLNGDGFIHELTGSWFGYMGGFYSITEYGMKFIEVITNSNTIKKNS